MKIQTIKEFIDDIKKENPGIYEEFMNVDREVSKLMKVKNKSYNKYLSKDIFEIKVRDNDLILTYKTHHNAMVAYMEAWERLKLRIKSIKKNKGRKK